MSITIKSTSQVYDSISEAINAVPWGQQDTIVITGETVSGSVNSNGGKSIAFEVVDSVVDQQVPFLNGGAFYINTSGNTFTDTEIIGNTASGAGGAFYVNSGSLLLDGCTVADNLGASNGGALRIQAGSYVKIVDSLIDSNSNNGDAGGAVYFNGDADTVLDIVNTTFSNNVSNGAGGGAFYVNTVGVLNFTDVDFVNNQTTAANKYGGAINNNGATIHMTGGSFYGNKSAAAGAIWNASGTIYLNGVCLDGNSSSGSSGAIRNQAAGTLYLADVEFRNNIASNGSAFYNFGKVYITGTVKLAAGETIWNQNGTVTVKGDEFFTPGVVAVKKVFDAAAANYYGGTAYTVEGEYQTFSQNHDFYITNAAEVVSGAAIVSDTADTGAAIYNGKAYYGTAYTDLSSALGANNTVVLSGFTHSGAARITLGSGKNIYGGAGVLIADNVNSSGGVFMANTAGGVNRTLENITFSANTATGAGGVVYLNNGAQVTFKNCNFYDNCNPTDIITGTYGGVAYIYNGELIVENSIFKGNKSKVGGAICVAKAGASAAITNCQFLTSSDTIDNTGGTVDFYGNITLNASLTGNNGIWNTAGADFTIGKGVALNGVDFDQATITVDGALYQGEAVTVATKVGKIGDFVITNNANPFLTLEVIDSNLVLKEIAGETITGTSYTGKGLTVMDGGAVGTFFATKDNESEIATKISGGKVESNLVGGAYVAAGNTAEVDKVELLIGGTAEVAAKVYAGGYLYGNGTDSAEAQLKVTEVNITLDGGAVSTNMYGGAHARQNGNASVAKVNITVTAGNHGRIYAGGWAEKGAVSSVGTSTVIISGGTVDYLYGGGANADGTTTVGTTTITIENSALVNTVFMSGRYGYSSVSDTVTLNYNSTTGMKRLSGVSSAGVDNAQHTVVNVLSDLTADLIDYVDKFVIKEGCTLTANDAFYLGNRLENGETDGFTTFDFIAEGKAEWTAVAGIDDFTNAKFAVNGEGLTAWDGKAAIAIGGYELTYNAEDKTIKLAVAQG